MKPLSNGLDLLKNKPSSISIDPQPVLPWDSEKKDPFFNALKIDGERWNRLYPYKLLVVKINSTGGFDLVNGGDISIKNSPMPDSSDRGISYLVSQQSVTGQWSYTFPITPQQFSITDTFAINTTATMRGVIEEHNGVKFKTITMSGTTGILPHKAGGDSSPKNPSILAGLFGNTMESFNNLSKQSEKIQKSFTERSKNSNAVPPDKYATDTGYFQALLLSQFLERYAQAKKNPENNNWRLVLDIPKENQSFICTPMQFSLNKSQQKPNEYLWSLQLKAWKRIEIQDSDYAANSPLSLDSPNMLSKINSAIRNTRRMLSSYVNLLKAVKSDILAPFDTLRQLALTVKDLSGAAISTADLPNSIIQDIKSSLNASSAIQSQAITAVEDRISSSKGMANKSLNSSFKLSAMTSGPDDQINKTNAQKEAATNQQKQSGGLTDNDVLNGALGKDAQNDRSISSTNKPFENPLEYFDFFDSVSLNSLSLTPEQQKAIDDDIEKIKEITLEDLQVMKSEITSLALDLSNYFGAGNSTYSSVYNRPAPKNRITPMTLEENEILESIFDTIQSLDILTANKSFDDGKKTNSLTYVGGIAADSGIDFLDATSKFLVPVPFGLSMELIAARYLGNPDKWIEIVTLNNLKSPYIDEEGFEYNLLSNATGRQFNVDDSAKKLYIGQKIILSSNIIPQFIRKISDIEQISENNFLITTTGLADLDNLKINNLAKVKAYLPGTVNSQDQIFIPTNTPSQSDDRITIPPAFRNDQLTKISKIDFLLTDNGDIAVNKLGDFRLANGLNNLVQALKIKIKTKKGTLLRHLDFGLGIQHGMSIADVENGDLMKELTRLVTQDSRFAGIERLDIVISGNTLKIDMAVTIANNSGVLPISFDI